MRRLMHKEKMMMDLKRSVLKYFVAFIVFSIYSCADPSDEAPKLITSSRVIPSTDISPRCKVSSFSIINMYYDELKQWGYEATSDFTERIALTYSNNKIIQVNGGLRRYPPGGTVSGFYWSNDVVENIVYSGNTITVNSVAMYSKEFVIVNDKIQSQNTTYYLGVGSMEIVNYSPGLHQYEYIGNTILEKKNGFIRRIFYIENGNLSKVELFFRNAAGDIIKKNEYLFSNYDTIPNLLKGKFFINGNFFKAFSQNNFRKFEMKAYDFTNGAYQLDTSQYAMFTLDIPADIFIRDCN